MANTEEPSPSEQFLVSIQTRETDESNDGTNQEQESLNNDCRPNNNDTGSEEPAAHLSSLQDHLKSGTALVRTLHHFQVLDAQLRQEILDSPTASVGEDGTFIGALPQKKGQKFASLLQDYLNALLVVPDAVRSHAMASFLQSNNVQEQQEQEKHYYHDYLLPVREQEVEFHSISRLGTPYQHVLKTLPPGWWIVWRLHIKDSGKLSSAQVEFSVYIDQTTTCEDVDRTLDTSALSDTAVCRELVHREVSSPSSKVGSYRFSPDVADPARATFEVTQQTYLGSCKVHLECTAVPHEAFKAACEAARDQTSADLRRIQSPLLYAIIDSKQHEENDDHRVRLSVEPLEDEEDENDATGENEDVEKRQAVANDDDEEEEKEDDESLSLPDIAEKDEEIQRLHQQVEKLTKDKEYVREELARITKLADDGKRKIQLMVSEKRVWSVARQEIQTELSRLSTELAVERQAKTALMQELDEAKAETMRLNGQVKFLENSAPTEQDEERQRELVDDAQSQVNKYKSTIAQMETEVETLKSQNTQLQAKVENQKKVYKQRLGRYKSETEEARMNNRILEGKVRVLEQELQRTTSSKKSSSRAKASKQKYKALDPKVAKFEHPNPRLNSQLVSLRDRHAQLVVLLEQNPNSEQNMELIGKIEKAMHDIVANAKKKADS